MTKCLNPDYCGTGDADTLCANCAAPAVQHPLATSQPPRDPAIAESTIRAIRRLPELLALAREVAANGVCGWGCGDCDACDHWKTAERLVNYIDHGGDPQLPLGGESDDPPG